MYLFFPPWVLLILIHLSPEWRATTARLINELDHQRKWKKRDEIGGHEQDIIEAEEEEEMKEKGGVAPIYHSDRWPCSWPWDLTASFSALISSLSSRVVHTFTSLISHFCVSLLSLPFLVFLSFIWNFRWLPSCIVSFCCQLPFSPKQQCNINNAWATKMNVLVRPSGEQDLKYCLFYPT